MKNIAVIAGYDVLADSDPAHREYAAKCLEFVKDHADSIYVVGGHTNPDHPEKSEAEANKKILLDLGWPKEKIIDLPLGNTAQEWMEALVAKLEHAWIGEIFICGEQARMPALAVDALNAGLLELAQKGTAYYGYRFGDDSTQKFAAQKTKIVIKVLSHYRLFRPIRWLLQKRHQKKVAAIKRRQF